MKALLIRFLVYITPVLLERFFDWVKRKVEEIAKKKEQDRKVEDLNNAKTEDELDSGIDNLP